MCALFGIHDYSNCFSSRQKNIILSALSQESQVRGIDATGISYVRDNKLQIYKRPLPAHRIRYSLPPNVKVVMGHTRMATQGSESKNCNNHPFFGRVKNNTFALAHNGILHNDRELRRSMNLPKTNIETDSYIAVQIIEKENAVTFDSLRKTAETVNGSFVFTVLDRHNNLYFVRGDNPICIYHFPANGFYLYASTEEILQQSLTLLGIDKYYNVRVPVDMGDILRIDGTGDIDRSKFKLTEYYSSWYRYSYSHRYDCEWVVVPDKDDSEYRHYINILKQTAKIYGYSSNEIDELIAEGFSLSDIEEMIGCFCDDDIYENQITFERVGG